MHCNSIAYDVDFCRKPEKGNEIINCGCETGNSVASATGEFQY